MQKQYMLLGNFGVGNLGDEAIADFYTTHVPGCTWNRISATPKQGEYHRLPGGVRSFFTPWYRTIIAYYRSDGLVVGGGTLFTDAESVYACFLWWLHVVLARLLRKPVYFAFQGIGPFKTKLGLSLTLHALKHAQYISVRDSESYTRLTKLGLQHITQTFDPVILMIEPRFIAYTHRSLVVIPRHNSTDAFLQVVKEAASELWEEVLLLSFHPTNTEEQVLLNQLQTLFAHSTIRSVTSITEAVNYIESASQVLSQRFHGTLIARVLGKEVRVTPQVASDKHSSIALEMQDVLRCKKRAEEGLDSLRIALKLQ